MSENICSIENCLKPRLNIRGWCVKHYQQWRRHGDPEAKDKKSPICSVENCGRKRYCRGFCSMHHQRWFKHGDPLICLAPVGRTMEERFWEKVDKKEKHECWLWTAGTDDDGYGIFGTEGTRAAKAHRVSYEMEYGNLPKELKVLHRCDTPPCVNPRHLYAGTSMDNMQDKIVRGRARYLHGEEHYATKLTDQKVRNIRRLAGQGVALKVIAKQYNISRSNADLIVRRKTWKHIE